MDNELKLSNGISLGLDGAEGGRIWFQNFTTHHDDMVAVEFKDLDKVLNYLKELI